MNFLAHIVLSGNSEEMMIGNFIGDFVKGNDMFSYDLAITRGIKLHREIDWFTDNHPLISKGKDRLWKNYRHYGSVIIDIFYDHFLAKDFEMYSDVHLQEFVKATYSTLLKFEPLMPRKAQRMLPYMINQNWLEGYSRVEGIEKTLQGLSRRTKFKSHMEKAGAELIRYYDLYREEFHTFFPEIVKHSNRFVEDLTNES